MSGRAQLFVGRLSKDTRVRDLEEVFERYGRLLRCDIKYGTGMAYAFVDYDDRRDAEDAIKHENGREIRGQSIVVEWARGPSYRPALYDECYRCHRTGHWARDCPEIERERYSYRSRSRSKSRYERSRSRSHSDNSNRRHSFSHSRDRSFSHSPSDDFKPREESYSTSPERKKSHSRSRSLSKTKQNFSRSRSQSKSPVQKEHRNATEHSSSDLSQVLDEQGNPSPKTSQTEDCKRSSINMSPETNSAKKAKSHSDHSQSPSPERSKSR